MVVCKGAGDENICNAASSPPAIHTCVHMSMAVRIAFARGGETRRGDAASEEGVCRGGKYAHRQEQSEDGNLGQEVRLVVDCPNQWSSLSRKMGAAESFKVPIAWHITLIICTIALSGQGTLHAMLERSHFKS